MTGRTVHIFHVYTFCMSKRINVVLLVGEQGVKEQLKAGYQANAKENLNIRREWFPVEEEAWRKSSAARVGKK